SFSRWYKSGLHEGELYRELSLTHALLTKMDVKNPLSQVVVVYGQGIATLVVSKSPFTRDELLHLQKITHKLRFEIVLAPFQISPNQYPVLKAILLTGNIPQARAELPLELSPTTDNRPYFFNMLSFKAALFISKNVFNDVNNKDVANSMNIAATVVLP